MALAKFMASPIGRGGRVLLGLILIVAGFMVGETAGWVISAVGLVPLALGAANICVLAPILGVPFKGSELGQN